MTGRACKWCREGIPTGARRDAVYCGQRCRQFWTTATATDIEEAPHG